VTDEGDVYMWEGWSKPAEFNNSRSTTGERVAQAVSGQERGSTSKRQQRRVTSADNSIQESAVARRGRKTERAKTLVQQPILPERCAVSIAPPLCLRDSSPSVHACALQTLRLLLFCRQNVSKLVHALTEWRA
jgi:hypothetical protein